MYLTKIGKHKCTLAWSTKEHCFLHSGCTHPGFSTVHCHVGYILYSNFVHGTCQCTESCLAISTTLYNYLLGLTDTVIECKVNMLHKLYREVVMLILHLAKDTRKTQIQMCQHIFPNWSSFLLLHRFNTRLWNLHMFAISMCILCIFVVCNLFIF